MNNIHIIYAGGTFGSHGTPLYPLDKTVFLPKLQEFLIDNLDVKMSIIDNPIVKDSSSLTPHDFVHFWEIIHQNIENTRQFIIITGTDTLSYLSAFLAVACNDLPVSIVVTGSMSPFFIPTKTPLEHDKDSDAWLNLSTAINFLTNQPKQGVFVSFFGKILWAINTQKMHTSDQNAFSGTQVQDTQFLTPYNTQPLSTEQLSLVCFETLYQNAKEFGQIYTLYALPNTPDTLASQIAYLKNVTPTALILIGFGAGNMAINERLQQDLQTLIDKGFLIIMSKAPPFGAISQSYKAGAWQSQIGIQSGFDMPVSEIYARALWICLNRFDDKKSAWQALYESVARP